MATTVPTNLENPGVQPKSQRLDNFGYIPYPKLRNAGSEAYDTRAFSAAANVTLNPSDFIKLIVFISTSTFAQVTLPATAALAAYLQRIYSVENQTGTTGGNPTPQEGKVYYFPFIIDNQRNTGVGATDLVTLVAGDGSTTFALGTNIVGRGLNKMLLRFATAGSPAVATLTVVPDFRTGGTSGPSFAAVPVYTPFPLQDADNLGVWDASNANQWSSMTRQQFFSGGVTNTNVLIGPGANYAATGAANVAIGSGSASALTTGTSNVILGSASGTTLTTGARNMILGAANMTDASAAAMTDSIFIGNSNNTLNAAQTASIIIGNGVTIAVGAAFSATTAIGSSFAANPTINGSTWTNRIRQVAGGLAMAMNGNEMTSAASNRYVKYGIEDLPEEEIEKFKQLRPRIYKERIPRLNKEGEVEFQNTDKQYFGFIADEVDKVLPEIIHYGNFELFYPGSDEKKVIEGPNFALSYDDRSIVALTIKTLQHALLKIKELEERLNNINA
jgi:hypothetical protein